MMSTAPSTVMTFSREELSLLRLMLIVCSPPLDCEMRKRRRGEEEKRRRGEEEKRRRGEEEKRRRGEEEKRRREE